MIQKVRLLRVVAQLALVQESQLLVQVLLTSQRVQEKAELTLEQAQLVKQAAS